MASCTRRKTRLNNLVALYYINVKVFFNSYKFSLPIKQVLNHNGSFNHNACLGFPYLKKVKQFFCFWIFCIRFFFGVQKMRWYIFHKYFHYFGISFAQKRISYAREMKGALCYGRDQLMTGTGKILVFSVFTIFKNLNNNFYTQTIVAKVYLGTFLKLQLILIIIK